MMNAMAVWASLQIFQLVESWTDLQDPVSKDVHTADQFLYQIVNSRVTKLMSVTTLHHCPHARVR